VGAVFLLLLMAYFTAMHAIVFGHSRYHLPLIPIVSIFAGWSLTHIRYILEKRHAPGFWVASGIAVFLIGVWLWEIVFVEARHLLSLQV
jgi:hypothetical protein